MLLQVIKEKFQVQPRIRQSVGPIRIPQAFSGTPALHTSQRSPTLKLSNSWRLYFLYGISLNRCDGLTSHWSLLRCPVPLLLKSPGDRAESCIPHTWVFCRLVHVLQGSPLCQKLRKELITNNEEHLSLLDN